MKKIKMLWDFKGQDAVKTAEHQCIHLKDFFNRESISFDAIEIEKYSDLHVAAYAIVDENSVELLRKTLKPNRGQLAD